MKNNRVWIEILLLSSAIALALALVFATVGAAAGSANADSAPQVSPSTRGQTYEGMVTCSRCGAKHSRALGQKADDCARTCVRGGASFVLVEPDATYILDGDLGTLGRLAGQRVRIVGELNGNTIKISSAVSET